MNVTEHEMIGLLTGKCLPGDMRVNEKLSAYLVRKFDEVKAQRDALAAENAALKELATGYADLADFRLSEITATCESDCRRECYEACNKTPATAAYLNSVRAEGVELVKEHPAVSLCSLTHVCEEIAAQLRAGKDGE